jgi:hypothetical protein
MDQGRRARGAGRGLCRCPLLAGRAVGAAVPASGAPTGARPPRSAAPPRRGAARRHTPDPPTAAPARPPPVARPHPVGPRRTRAGPRRRPRRAAAAAAHARLRAPRASRRRARWWSWWRRSGPTWCVDGWLSGLSGPAAAPGGGRGPEAARQQAAAAAAGRALTRAPRPLLASVLHPSQDVRTPEEFSAGHVKGAVNGGSKRGLVGARSGQRRRASATSSAPDRALPLCARRPAVPLMFSSPMGERGCRVFRAPPCLPRPAAPPPPPPTPHTSHPPSRRPHAIPSTINPRHGPQPQVPGGGEAAVPAARRQRGRGEPRGLPAGGGGASGAKARPCQRHGSGSGSGEPGRPLAIPRPTLHPRTLFHCRAARAGAARPRRARCWGSTLMRWWTSAAASTRGSRRACRWPSDALSPLNLPARLRSGTQLHRNRTQNPNPC